MHYFGQDVTIENVSKMQLTGTNNQKISSMTDPYKMRIHSFFI